MIDWIMGRARIFDVPDRLTDVSSWHMHVPFAFWCVESIRPRVLVELGTHRGDSYSAFCQAVARSRLPTACYAVDTWQGDAHAGEYGEEVYQEFREYHDARYASFSRLMRCTFDEASKHFADGSIDLLHIDGLHTYDAARHDLETWAPRMSRSGVILFHDVNVRENGFGVWKLWDEIRGAYPSFTFHHGHGLGVALWGAESPADLRRLAASDPGEAFEIRELFAHLGSAAAARARLRGLESERRTLEGRLHEAISKAGLRERELIADAERKSRALEELGAQVAQLRQLSLERQEQLARFEAAMAERDRDAERLRRELDDARSKRRGLTDALARLPQRLRHAGSVALLVLYWALTFQLAAGLRRRRYARLIRRAGLFDAAFYRSQLGGQAGRIRDPLDHYLRKGAGMGLDPNPFFDTSWYLENNPDVAARARNPLVHYIRHGAGEGRATSPRFDTACYLAWNPEVRGCGLNPLTHYLQFGAAQGLRSFLPSGSGDVRAAAQRGRGGRPFVDAHAAAAQDPAHAVLHPSGATH